MREIKFRAWDKVNKNMLYDVSTGTVTIWYKEISAKSENCVFMQYTGMTGKNGKEIYEGDIVKLENILFKVVYVNGHDSDYYDLFPRCAYFGLVPLNQNKDEPLIQIMDFQFDDEYRYEVIGNIFKEKYLEEIKNGDWDDDNY